MSIETNRIVGAGPKENRKPMDFYPTPPDVTQALLDMLDIPKGATIWEPACGAGDLARVLSNNGYKTILTDIQYGQDFLTTDLPAGVDWIITNPPFSLADKFIERAWEFKKPFALLLKSQYWHAAKRLELFYDCTPSCIFPLTWRPDFDGRGAPLMDVMWCVWKFGPDEPMFPAYLPITKNKGNQL